MVVVVVIFPASTTLRFVIACGLEPLAGTGATVVFLTVVVLAPNGADEMGTRGFAADGADTALARAEAEPTVVFLAAVLLLVVADAGRVDNGARVVVVVCNKITGILIKLSFPPA